MQRRPPSSSGMGLVLSLKKNLSQWHDWITVVRWPGPWWCRWWRGYTTHSRRAIHSRNTSRNTSRNIIIRFFKDLHFPGWRGLVKLLLYMIKREVCGILWNLEFCLEKNAFGMVQASINQPEGKPHWSQCESQKQSVWTSPWNCKTNCFAWWMTWQ